MQLECGVKAIFPAKTSALSFFICSRTHGFRKVLLLRSAIKKVGCLPVTAASWLLMRGWAGSLRIGLIPPGTIEKSTLKVSHPALPEEKSGGEGFCCAAAAAASSPQ